MTNQRHLALVGVVLGTATGCVAAGSSSRAPGNPETVAAALAEGRTPEARPSNSLGKPLAFVVSTGPGSPKITAYDLDAQKVLWAQDAEVKARIAVGKTILLATEKSGALVARDLATGKVKWEDKLAAGATRLGYCIDGDDAYQVIKTAASGGRGMEAQLQALDPITGAPRWRLPLPASAAGGPAARGGLVAVPFRSQYVMLVDGRKGVDLAQILAKDEAATFVLGLPEGLFFGSKGVFLASGETATATRKAGYMRATVPKFVRDVYYWDLYRPEQSDYSALDRNRLLWRAETDGPKTAFRNGLAYIHNYRFFFGFDAKSGDLRWAYNVPRVDAVSSAHTGNVIAFATADGEIGALDVTTGMRHYSSKLAGLAVRGVTFDAEGWKPAGAEGEVPHVAPVLSSIIWDPDRRISDVKIFAVDQLARQPGRVVTGELLKILDKEGLAPAIYQKAADSLIERKDKEAVDLYIKALEVQYDYGADRKPRGIDTLARAVAGMKAREAVPGLVAHLRSPETPPVALVELAEALVAIEGRDALPAMRDFLLQYRADPSYAGDPAPLISVTEAVLKLGGLHERELLLFVAEEPKTIDALRAHIRRALAQTREPTGKKGKGSGSEKGAE